MTTNPEEQSSTKTPDQLTGWEEVAALAKTPEEFATDLKRGEAPDTTSDTAASIDSEIDPADEGIPYDKYGEYDDYEEPDPNSPEARFFAKYDAYEKLEPHFKSSIHGLLDQSDEHDIFSDKYDNFLITADFLPELADCTEDRDIAIIARGDFEDTLDDWAKEQGYDYQDDEDSDHLTNQVLAASAILAARLHADGDISSRQLDLSKRVINNLGLSIPFNPNDRYVRDALDNMTQHGFDLNDQLKAAGLLDQSFYNDIHQNDLVRVFKEAHVDVPEHLQNFSPEMQKYWNDISDELGIDAFTIYLDSVKSSLRHSQIQNPDHPVSPAIYFDDAGQPTPIAFAEGSTLFADAFRSPHEHKAHPDASYALLNKFSDKLVPTDKCLLDALGNAIAENDDEHLRSGLIHFYHTSYSRDDFDDTGHPNEIFWSRAGHSDDLGIIRLFPGYEEHFSPSRIAAAHLPANTREHLRRYTDKFWGKEDAVLDETLMPDGQLSQKFYSGKVLGNLSAENLVKDFPNELAEHFDATARSYLDLPSSYRDFLIQHSEDLAKNQPDFDYKKYIENYIDESGPTNALFEDAFSDGRFDLLFHSPLREEKDPPLSTNQRYALGQYQQILMDDPDHGRDVATEYAHAIAMFDLDGLSHEQIDSLASIVNRVTNSNAYELRNSGRNFLRDIIRSDDPERAIDSIEEVFLRNNLPYAGKVFRTFEVLHPADTAFDHEFARSSVITDGVLKNLPNTGPLSRESVLFADLIKSSIQSNNHPMRQYIKNLRVGQNLSDQLLNGETTYDDLSKAEQSTLSTFTDHVATLYNQTYKGKRETFQRTTDLTADLRQLTDAFGPTNRYNLSDRIVRSFCYPLGLRGLDDLETYMDESIATADSRNRERFINNDFSLRENDLVKAVDAEYIGRILQNGSVCKEFLNGEAESDNTPLDTDITRLGAECTGNINAAIDWKNDHAAFMSMAINLVIKDSTLIQTDNDRYDPTKLELLDNGDSNCGIRTGFPSSAIDFIVFDGNASYLQSSRTAAERNRLYSEIAKNGFYIPVVDKASGACIFSPDDFDNLRRKLSGLEQYDAPEFLFANDADLYTPGIESLTDAVLTQDAENSRQYSTIQNHLTDLIRRDFPDFRGLKDVADGDLTPNFIELIDTGSTGRGTSIPGSKADFDFIMRLDASTYLNQQRRVIFEDTLRTALDAGEDRSNSNGLRLKNVPVPGLDDPVDIDVSFVQRTNHLEFSSDQAIKERLETIRTQDPERYPAVVANIVLAKQLMKNANVYKPRHSSDTFDSEKKGGLGGIGIENWILQNGGSLKVAAESFVAAADQAGDDFTVFCATYPIWDAGQNHFAIRNNEENHYDDTPVYNNFVADNMDADGFQRMTTTLRNYLSLIKT